MKYESRYSLWYGKYAYRTKLLVAGLNYTHRASTYTSYLKRLENLLSSSDSLPSWSNYGRGYISKINLDIVERWYRWRFNHLPNDDVLIRVLGNSVSVFSNDLTILQDLENVDPDTPITYTQAIPNIPAGVKYYVKEPKHRYRLYLKDGKLPAGSTLAADLREFIDRYEGTTTVIEPSESLTRWLSRGTGTWQASWVPENCGIDYDEPSTHTLLVMMFGNMIASHIKLEKRPAGINTP